MVEGLGDGMMEPKIWNVTDPVGGLNHFSKVDASERLTDSSRREYLI